MTTTEEKTVMMGEISFKIEFLRTMTSIMTEPDLDQFENICWHFLDGSAVLADLVLLDQLYKKFEGRKPSAP